MAKKKDSKAKEGDLEIQGLQGGNLEILVTNITHILVTLELIVSDNALKVNR